MSDRPDYLDWWLIGMVAALIAIGAFLFGAARQAARQAAICTDNGGHWERRNCHEVEEQTCTVVDYSNMLQTCISTPATQCDSVCIGARAESSTGSPESH